MSLPWSAQQREWLREMGFEVLGRRGHPAKVATLAVPPAFQRLAHGVDLAALLADGFPADVAGRRALWRRLRPLRKAARAR